MSVSTPAQLSRIMKGKKNVLILAGSLCEEMELGDRKLCDYAADISLKLGAPVAASGNSIGVLKAKGAAGAKKAAIQMVEMFRHEGWRDPIMPQRPDMLVLIGFPNEIARALASAAQGVETMVLGTAVVDEATHSLGDASQLQFKQYLEEILKRLD